MLHSNVAFLHESTHSRIRYLPKSKLVQGSLQKARYISHIISLMVESEHGCPLNSDPNRRTGLPGDESRDDLLESQGQNFDPNNDVAPGYLNI